MNRRTFLLTGAAVVVAGSGVYSWRRMMAGNSAMHDMAGMRDMPGMSQKPRRIVALPEGRPLPELPLLKNQSSKTGQFAGVISIDVVRKEFVAGKSTELFTYNGTSPGPVIEAREGDSVSVAVTNNLKDRDTTVHFEKEHWQSEKKSDPKPTRHVGKLWIGRWFSRYHLWL